MTIDINSNISVFDRHFRYTYRLHDLLYFRQITPDWWRLALLKLGVPEGKLRFGFDQRRSFSSFGEFSKWWHSAKIQRAVIEHLHRVKIRRSGNVLGFGSSKPVYFYADTEQARLATLIYYQNKFIGHQYGWLRGFMRDNVVVDIGATIAESAIQFVKDYKARRVYAIEPLGAFCRIAKKNIELNHLADKIRIVKVAVGKSNKRIRLADSFVGADSSALKPSKSGSIVRQYTLARLIDGLGVPDGSVLKVDVFGMEYEMILSAKCETLRRFSAIFIVSYFGYKNLETKLKESGFRVRHKLIRYQYSPDFKDDVLITYIMAERIRDYLFPHTLLATLISPLLTDGFGELLTKQVGSNYACFYSGRNGIYHVLMYLKRKYGAHRIHLSRYFLNAGQSVPIVSKRAGYQILWYEDKPQHIRRNDVILFIDSRERLPSRISESTFKIQDSASNLQPPSSAFDFAVYSFNQDKPLAAAGGGVVVVENPKFMDFLEIRDRLEPLALGEEAKMYLDSIEWRIRAYTAVRMLGKKYLILTKGEEGAREDAVFRPEGKFTHIYYGMPKITKRLASTYMPIRPGMDSLRNRIKR